MQNILEWRCLLSIDKAEIINKPDMWPLTQKCQRLEHVQYCHITHTSHTMPWLQGIKRKQSCCCWAAVGHWWRKPIWTSVENIKFMLLAQRSPAASQRATAPLLATNGCSGAGQEAAGRGLKRAKGQSTLKQGRLRIRLERCVSIRSNNLLLKVSLAPPALILSLLPHIPARQPATGEPQWRSALCLSVRTLHQHVFQTFDLLFILNKLPDELI